MPLVLVIVCFDFVFVAGLLLPLTSGRAFVLLVASFWLLPDLFCCLEANGGLVETGLLDFSWLFETGGCCCFEAGFFLLLFVCDEGVFSGFLLVLFDEGVQYLLYLTRG